MADLFGPPPLEQWPADLRYLYEERAGIKSECMPVELAEAHALREVWERNNG